MTHTHLQHYMWVLYIELVNIMTYGQKWTSYNLDKFSA